MRIGGWDVWEGLWCEVLVCGLEAGMCGKGCGVRCWYVGGRLESMGCGDVVWNLWCEILVCGKGCGVRCWCVGWRVECVGRAVV